MQDIDTLITRAEMLLAFMSEKEVVEYFYDEGIANEIAFLAIKAAQVGVNPT